MSESEAEKAGIQIIRKNFKNKKRTNLGMDIIKLMGEDFIVNDMSIAQLAEKYNVIGTTVQSICQTGKWTKKRQIFREKMVQQTMKDCEVRYKHIASDVAEVFYKQSQYISRRLKLLKDGEPVPKELMNQALKLHEIVSKDLMKVKDVDKKLVPSKIEAIASGMPSVIDMIDYIPKETKPPQAKPKVEVEASVLDAKEESKEDK